jgi:hypothetical protein
MAGNNLLELCDAASSSVPMPIASELMRDPHGALLYHPS